MSAIDYLQKVVKDKSAYVPTTIAESVRSALLALGYNVHCGALDWSNCNIVLYLA